MLVNHVLESQCVRQARARVCSSGTCASLSISSYRGVGRGFLIVSPAFLLASGGRSGCGDVLQVSHSTRTRRTSHTHDDTSQAGVDGRVGVCVVSRV